MNKKSQNADHAIGGYDLSVCKITVSLPKKLSESRIDMATFHVHRRDLSDIDTRKCRFSSTLLLEPEKLWELMKDRLWTNDDDCREETIRQRLEDRQRKTRHRISKYECRGFKMISMPRSREYEQCLERTYSYKMANMTVKNGKTSLLVRSLRCRKKHEEEKNACYTIKPAKRRKKE
jgi:hypothetical protein